MLDSGDDFVGICFPDKRACFLIMLLDEAIDGGLQVDDGMEDTFLKALPG